jgi:hypothetical protein
MQRTVFTFFILAITISCSSTKKHQCHKINWEEMGKNDVLNGFSTKRNEYWKNSCPHKFNQEKQSLYLKGQKAGIEAFCTFEYGLKFGETGQKYQQVCPKKLEREFLKGYRLGLKNFDKHRTQKAIEQQVKDLEEGRDY